MAQIPDPPRRTNRRSSCFLGCFGFSMEVVPEKVAPENDPLSSGSSRKEPRWPGWSRLRKKNSGTKTVPVDASDRSRENIQGTKAPAEKFASKRRKARNHIPATVAASGKTVVAATEETRYGAAQNTVLDNPTPPDHSNSIEEDTCQIPVTSNRKTEPRRAAAGHTGSQVLDKGKSRRAATISHSASFPARNNPPKQATIQPGYAQVKIGRLRETKPSAGDKFDPVIGMSIVMVTLLMMVFWGRLCAILCTAGWCYFIPRLKSRAKSNTTIQKSSNNPNSNSGELDLSSEEYKKKVVLEGFLERNHRAAFERRSG